MPVYIAARDLAGLPFGTHQFIIIENQYNPHPSAKLNLPGHPFYRSLVTYCYN